MSYRHRAGGMLASDPHPDLRRACPPARPPPRRKTASGRCPAKSPAKQLTRRDAVSEHIVNTGVIAPVNGPLEDRRGTVWCGSGVHGGAFVWEMRLQVGNALSRFSGEYPSLTIAHHVTSALSVPYVCGDPACLPRLAPHWGWRACRHAAGRRRAHGSSPGCSRSSSWPNGYRRYLSTRVGIERVTHHDRGPGAPHDRDADDHARNATRSADDRQGIVMGGNARHASAVRGAPDALLRPGARAVPPSSACGCFT